MRQITFTKTVDGKTITVTFTEGDRFEFKGCAFEISAIKERGKMVIKPSNR